jgi:hypothetical protein
MANMLDNTQFWGVPSREESLFQPLDVPRLSGLINVRSDSGSDPQPLSITIEFQRLFPTRAVFENFIDGRR